MADQNQPQQPQRNPQTNPGDEEEGDEQTTGGAVAAEDFSDNENSLGSAPNTRPENRTNADANA